VPFFRSFGRSWFEFGLEGETYELGTKSLSGNERNRLWRNDGDGRFTEVGWVSGVASPGDGRGFVAADFDRDGDQDFFLVNSHQPAQYWENRHPRGGHWLGVKLSGRESNSQGIGARLTFVTGERSQVREMHCGSGYLSTPPPEVHVGLGDATVVDRLEVRWPSGEVQVVEDVAVDQVLVIEEGGAARPLER